MFKKVALTFVTCILFILSTILFESCRAKDGWICDIYFCGITNNKYYNEDNSIPDDLTEDLGFLINTKKVSPNQCQTAGLNILNSCYATTLCYKWFNELSESSFSMKFNREIILNNEIIPENTDIFQNDIIKTGIIIEKFDKCKTLEYTIKFTDELKNILNFESGIYTVTFSCKTTDGIFLEKEKDVIFKN